MSLFVAYVFLTICDFFLQLYMCLSVVCLKCVRVPCLVSVSKLFFVLELRFGDETISYFCFRCLVFRRNNILLRRRADRSKRLFLVLFSISVACGNSSGPGPREDWILQIKRRKGERHRAESCQRGGKRMQNGRNVIVTPKMYPAHITILA